MPWRVVADHSECGEGRYAVVKDATDEVEGCHMSREDAESHMRALYANTDDTHRGGDAEGESRLIPFDPEEHPRVPSGSGGGQFAPAGGSGGKKTTVPAKTGVGRRPTSGKKRRPHRDPDALAYDPDSNSGTGYGSKEGDPRVKRLQVYLTRLGLTDADGKKLKLDGKLGPKTTAAVKAAQKRLGLKQDGVVTRKLLDQLAEMKQLPKRSMDDLVAAILMQTRASDPDKPYGDVTYADPGYQDDGKKRCRAAWSYINQESNAKLYSAEQLQRIKSRIKAAGKKYGITFADDEDGRSRVLPAVCVRAFDFDSRSGDGRTLEGYAAVYNTPARIRDLQGDFDEVIRPGAFTRSLSRRMPVMQWEHGKDPRVGSVPIATIRELDPDNAKGLYVRAELMDDPLVEPIRKAISAGTVKGMSFRFEVPKTPAGDKWSRGKDGAELREIYDADTYEIGPVVFPAYDATSVSVRSILANLDAAERRALVHELAAEVRLAVGLTPSLDDVEDEDFTVEPDARSAGGGDRETPASQRGATHPSLEDLQTRDRVLHVLGVL